MSIDAAEYLVCWLGIAWCICTGIAVAAIYHYDRKGPQ